MILHFLIDGVEKEHMNVPFMGVGITRKEIELLRKINPDFKDLKQLTVTVEED